jgi:hypothetical protein
MWLLLRTNILEEHIASIIRVERINKLGTLAVTSHCLHLDDGSDAFLRNISSYKRYTASHPRR